MALNTGLCVVGWYSAVRLWWCVMLCLYQCAVVHGRWLIIIIVWR